MDLIHKQAVPKQDIKSVKSTTIQVRTTLTMTTDGQADPWINLYGQLFSDA